MKKEEQILRIKELINESTLYGKLVDKELLNEGGGKKGVVSTIVSAEQLLKKLISGVDEKYTKQAVTSLQTSLNTINNKITKNNITNKLNPSSTDNIYDEVGNALKKELKSITTGAGFNSPTLLTKEVETQIDNLVGQMKTLNLHEFKNKFDEMPESLKEILDSVPNIRTQYSKMRPIWKLINDIPVQNIVTNYFNTILQPLKVWENLPEAFKIYKTLLTKDAEGKRKTVKKILQAQSALVGGRKSFITIFVTVAIKDALRAFVFCPEYEKIELTDPRKENRGEVIKNVVTKEKDEKMNEQKEGEGESISKKQQKWISVGLELLLNIFIPEVATDPIGFVSRTLQRFGVDNLKGMGLVGEQTWLECATSEEHKELIDIINENLTDEEKKEFYDEYEKVKSNVENHVTSTIKKTKEIVNGHLTNNGISIEEVQNVTQDDIDAALEGL